MPLCSLKEHNPFCHPSAIHRPGSVVAGNITLAEKVLEVIRTSAGICVEKSRAYGHPHLFKAME